MLIASVIIFFILIFPILLNINLIFSAKNKKIYFCVSLFGLIKIFGGYIKLVREGIALHYSENKAIIIPYKNIIGIRKKVKPIKDYHFISINSLIELDTESFIENKVILSYLYVTHNELVCNILSEVKPYLRLKNNVCLYTQKDLFNIYLKSYTIFNILMILLSIIKISLEKIIYAFSRKKQQN